MDEIVLKIALYIFLFVIAIVLIFVAIAMVFVALYLAAMLVIQYPIRVNLIFVIALLIFGMPIHYVAAIYFIILALFFAIYWWCSTSELEKVVEPELLHIEEQEVNGFKILPEIYNLLPSQLQKFQAEGFDKSGNKIDPGIVTWAATGGSISAQGELTVNANSKGKYEVVACTADGKLKYTIYYTVVPKLSSIRIEQPINKIFHGENIQFKLLGIDQAGEEMIIQEQVFWHTTIEKSDSIGRIDSTGRLVVERMNEVALVTAKIGNLKDEIKVDIVSNTIVEARASSNSTATEDLNNIFHQNENVNYASYLKAVLPYPTLSFNSNNSQSQKKIDSKIFKEHNLSQISESCNYEDDNEKHCLKQESISSFTVIKNTEASRLVGLGIKPDFVCLNPNQEQIFTVYGIDQFGAKISPGDVKWEATGGKIDSQGKLIIHDNAKGSFRVKAMTLNVERQVFQRGLFSLKISFKLFFWVLSHDELIKNAAYCFIREFRDSELLANEIFPEIVTNNINDILTMMTFDDVKEWIFTTAIGIIIDYLDKFTVLCFEEESSSLICYANYVVLPKL